ncbi:cyanophycin synthetase [Clostridium sp. 'deep sea']|uniref:cyanophycin synthetase n=1 Tax=Clostridium sp. 'deep sea' TaxID=2779445 RepID=UPI0018965E02|nr:cyanophycin synthetase [Clostridium sp. 'deep sea']QOR34505.1 cyanophycin synthetase [Clostridium sp. 'deep sea']
MRIESVSLIEGKNIDSHFPVVVMQLNLEEYAEVTTKDIGVSFINRLVKLLPGLNEHKCSKGYVGGFVERLQEGTLLGHVVEHIALELQEMLGVGTYYGKTRRVSQGIYNIIYEYKAAVAAEKIAYVSVDIVKRLLKNDEPNINNIINELKDIIEKTELGPSTKAIVTAAQKRNIPVTRLDNNSLIQLGYGAKSVKIQATLTEKTSCIAVDIACDKDLTKKRLRYAGLPVPYGAVCENVEQALDFHNNLLQPIVIKPVDGNQGKGVSLNLTTSQAITEAFKLAKKYCNEVLVEKYIEGNHYRCAVVDGKLIAVSWRIPAHVIGDGLHSITELIDIENLNPLRGNYHEKPLTKLKYDPIVKQVLKRQKLNIKSVPEKGKQVFLRENANLSTGGIAYDVTDMIHPDNKRLVESAVKIIGLDVAGIDIVLDDIENSYEEYGGAIIEINAAPGLRMHHYPAKGESRDVASAIVDYLFPNKETGRIPLVSVTGTNGKTTTVRLIAHMLANKYDKVGYTTSDGIYINEQRILTGDTTGPISTKNLLERKEINAAVLELARGGILRGGLAYDYSDVAVVTNVGYDHIGQDGILSRWELADLKALTLEAVNQNGYAVINADDAFETTMTKSSRCKIIYFSLKSNNSVVVEHINCGERAVIVKDNKIIYYSNREERTLVDVKSIPITFNGKAKHNIANILAAVAVGISLNLTDTEMIKAIRSFKPNIINNPGRQTIIEMPDGKTIMIDYAHNQLGLESLASFAKNLNYNKIIGVICGPGDRTAEQLIEMGRIVAKGFDKVVFKEDKDNRGRKQGDTAALLLEGYYLEKPNGFANIIEEETKAIEHAINLASKNDLIIINYEKLADCLKSINIAYNRIYDKKQKNLIAGA